MTQLQDTTVLGISDSLLEPLDACVARFATSPRPVFGELGSRQHVPPEIQSQADFLIDRLPEYCVARAERYLLKTHSSDQSRWCGLGFLIEDAKALRFRKCLQGAIPDPLQVVYESCGRGPDTEGLVPAASLAGATLGPTLGPFDVAICPSMSRQLNSMYWLTEMIAARPSCRFRLDPIRFAPLGTLPRMSYRMIVYGPPFDWERILALDRIEAVRWMADKDDIPDPEIITEMVWKPRGDEIVLEMEELPRRSDVWISGSRYLHAVLDRANGQFKHLDGALRWFDDVELATRASQRLDRAGAIGQRTKVFRLDEPISRVDAIDFISAFFVWNYDIAAYFDPNPHSLNAHLSHRKAQVSFFAD